ncbi:MAG: polysaccharide pyruvyl transferase family protein, partial [Microcystaceae cyanobacterium]
MNSHNSESSKFLLVGNGPYKNRGCEAIVRGTMNILRHHFGQNVHANVGIYSALSLLKEQITSETDDGINTFLLNHTSQRWSRDWIEQKLNTSIGLNLPSLHRPITSYLQDAMAALEIGGDTYSLDYGTPMHYLNMDSFLLSRGIPLVLWGASVGPFDREPEFAEKMFANLKRFSAIFVRESISQAYLQKNGIE